MSEHILLSYTPSKTVGAETLLYLHGFLGCQDDWNEVIEIIGDGFNHCRVDLPGHGARHRALSPQSYSMPGYANLLVAALNDGDVDQCNLVGYSMGGRFALFLLTHFPLQFSRVVIESASPGLKTADERKARCAEDDKLIEKLRAQPIDEFLRDWYDQPLFATIDKTNPRFEALLENRRSHDSTGLALALENMGSGVMPSLWDRLPRIKAQVLFIAGENDAKYSALAHEMANLCPRGQVAIIPGAGHNTHYERPEEYCRVVTQFLGEDD